MPNPPFPESAVALAVHLSLFTMWCWMNIVVSNVKGGVGKTTTAVYLSGAAVARGYEPVLLIDTDRQASSAEWLEGRPIEGVTVIEAPSVRTLTRAMGRDSGLAVVDTPPGDERLLQSASAASDVVVIPSAPAGSRFHWSSQCSSIPDRTPRGLVICSARLGTNDLEETIALWKGEKIPIWGVIPERVGTAAGLNRGFTAKASRVMAPSFAVHCAHRPDSRRPRIRVWLTSYDRPSWPRPRSPRA